MNLTKTTAGLLPQINPELANANPERVHQKAKRLVVGIILGLVGLLLLGVGVVAAWRLGAVAIAAQQPVSLGLILSLTLPLVPGLLLTFFGALRLDPDAGGAFAQLATFVGAIRQASKGGS